MRRASLISLLVLGALLQAGCSGITKGNSNTSSSPTQITSGGINVSVSPSGISVRVGGSQTFTATVSGSSNTSVNWQVNGVTGGSAAAGTISATGLYTPPSSVPVSNTVTVSAVSAANSGASGSTSVTLLNPVPVVNNVAPASVPSGSFNITVSGGNFVNGAQVWLGSSPLTTSLISSTLLTATGVAASVGTFAISVRNPNPGSSSSGSVNFQVTSNTSGRWRRYGRHSFGL